VISDQGSARQSSFSNVRPPTRTLTCTVVDHEPQRERPERVDFYRISTEVNERMVDHNPARMLLDWLTKARDSDPGSCCVGCLGRVEEHVRSR
jgi:hypothetical protein